MYHALCNCLMQPSNNKMSNSEIRKSNLVPSFNMKYFLISFAKDLALLQPCILIQASAEFYWVRQLIRYLSAHRYVSSERATTLSRVRHILHMYNESLSRARHTITLYVYLTGCLVPKGVGTEGQYIPQEVLLRACLLNTITRELVTYILSRARHTYYQEHVTTRSL